MVFGIYRQFTLTCRRLQQRLRHNDRRGNTVILLILQRDIFPFLNITKIVRVKNLGGRCQRAHTRQEKKYKFFHIQPILATKLQNCLHICKKNSNFAAFFSIFICILAFLTYILGPCAAESRDQILRTAEQISEISRIRPDSDVRFIFRAGVWKPRTSPNTFQGAGAEGLQWLGEVKARFGLPVATEVATPEHVEAALKAGVDYLWIGARTSANPIAVQAISYQVSTIRHLNAEGSRLKALIIKNPVNNDAALWLGNIERLEKTGVPVMAIHRGCNHQPCWSMAHTVRLARPDIPLLLDPSHLSGDATQVPAMLRKVEELGLDGAMVEVHCDPESALSDTKQQIRPDELERSLRSLTGYRPATPDRIPTDSVELNWLRAEIDELDEHLWETIEARMEVSRRIGEWKKAHGVAPLQPERYRQIKQKLQAKGEYALNIWELIHEESLKQQR